MAELSKLALAAAMALAELNRGNIDSAKTWMKSPEKVSPIQAGGGAPDGTQRNMLALQEVEYLITAELRLTEIGKDTPHEEWAALGRQLIRLGYIEATADSYQTLTLSRQGLAALMNRTPVLLTRSPAISTTSTSTTLSSCARSDR